MFSADPAKVVLALDPGKPGSASLTLAPLTVAYPVYVQALATDGEVPVTVSAPGLDSVVTTIRLATPVLRGFNVTGTLTLAEGETTTVGTSVGPSFDSLLVNPGADSPHIGLDNSNPSVASVTPSFVDLQPLSPGSASFAVKGLAGGKTTLALIRPAGFATVPAPQSITVTVAAKPLLMANLELGKDLSTPMTILLPYSVPAGVSFTVASSDPAMVRVSPHRSGLVGQAQFTSQIFSPSNSVTFDVEGLAAQGAAKITATVAGVGSVSSTVTLDPSGIAWSTDLYSALINGSYADSPLTLVPCALDSATLIPVATQSLRSGVSALIQVSNSNPDVATVIPSYTISAPSGFGLVSVTAKSVGSTQLRIVQPPGFTVPASRQTLKVKITTP